MGKKNEGSSFQATGSFESVENQSWSPTSAQRLTANTDAATKLKDASTEEIRKALPKDSSTGRERLEKMNKDISKLKSTQSTKNK